jgi:O-acetylhomoserine (thiol)-lyase
MRDLGSIQSPQNAFYLNLGLQTLLLRMRRVSESALQVATFLKNHPSVQWIHYADLEGDAYHALQQKYLPDGTCGVMALAVKGGRAFAEKFMDSLELVTIETHVADCYTCLLHPASHTHRQLSDAQLAEAGIDPDLIRLSIGLEDPEDIIADLAQALEKAQ